MNFNLLASSAAAGGGQGGIQGILLMVAYVAVIGGAMYFIMIRPQRKKTKAEKAMRENIQVGDEIITIGGVYGRVVSVKDDSLVIESSSDRSKQRIAVWAVQTNNTVHDE